MLTAFETGVRYQMYHALLLLFVALAPLGDQARKGIFWLTLCGVLCFSGSLYVLAMGQVLSLDVRMLGPVTPIGGFLLIAAWSWLFLDFFRRKA